jgi:ABC-2 type transport system permease protein
MSVSLFFNLLSMEIRKILSYRVDFWIGNVSFLIVRFVLMYFLYKSLFEGRSEIRGFDFAGINLFVFLAAISRKMTMGESHGVLHDDIYSGGLSKFLVMPANLFAYKFVSHIAETMLALFQLVLGLILYCSVFGTAPLNVITLHSTVLALVSVFLGSLIYFFMAIIIDSVAFYADAIWGLHVIARNLIEFAGGAAIPLAFFSESLRFYLAKLPFYFIGGFPIECLLGKLQPEAQIESFLFLLFWLCALYFLAKSFFQKGLKSYSGVGM